MALGITEDNGYLLLSVPLKLNDVGWTIEHLRELANTLEMTKPKSILKIGTELIAGYDSIDLIITCE